MAALPGSAAAANVEYLTSGKRASRACHPRGLAGDFSDATEALRGNAITSIVNIFVNHFIKQVSLRDRGCNAVDSYVGRQ